MTGFEITTFGFDSQVLGAVGNGDSRLRNWPVVYIINNSDDIYVGETGHVVTRMRQHLESESKSHLRTVKVVLDGRFNKSACLDLESHLIGLFSGDGKYAVLNRNEGITNADYYDRHRYRQTFDEIVERLRVLGMFEHTVPEIENQDLFKLSPFKALNEEQAIVVDGIAEDLRDDLEGQEESVAVVQGPPGTGKTIVGIFLMKLLRDLGVDRIEPDDEVEGDSVFSDLFLEGSRERFKGLTIGMVVPQQSLRASIKRVFMKSPALRGVRVMSPFDVGEDADGFDVLVVDEAHRLTQLSAQSIGTLTKKYKEISTALFGRVDPEKSQLDWIQAKARHVILLLDSGQTVRPSDVDSDQLYEVVSRAGRGGRRYRLTQQMRVRGGSAYIEFIQRLFSDEPPDRIPDIGDYDLRLFDDLGAMREEIMKREREVGLSRLVAGYAWPWRSKKDREAYDIEIDGVSLRWNTHSKDWINSKGSINEVGSIHTVQGYDLNFAGVIIGKDLRLDPRTGVMAVSRDDYYDSAGKRNNLMRGQETTDDDLLRYIRNIYSVLMTRGMRGTYVYVVDDVLRERFRNLLDPRNL